MVEQHKQLPHLLYLIAHTHWDREWYLPFQKFRMHLVNLIDNLVPMLEKNPDYRHFNLDGQTIVIEDYLEIRPDMEQRIVNLVKNNRIGIGPWYNQPDEWTSGELIARNLLVGCKLCKRFGGGQKIGYAPDLFGHVSQMPQILQLCGIDTYMFSRGLGDEMDDPNFSNEFIWEGPDGSKLLAFYMPGAGYSNAKNHPDDQMSFNNFMLFIFGMLGGGRTHVYFIGCGGDHYFFQPNTTEFIKGFNDDEDIKEELAGGKLIHGSLTEFFNAIKEQVKKGEIINPSVPLLTVKGELRQGRSDVFEPGTISSRMYLKQMNALCWRTLCYLTEPVSVLNNLLKHPTHLQNPEPDSAFINLAWKFLLQNQPHDSICGCSNDEIHREMEYRFASCMHISEELIKEHMEAVLMRQKSIPKNAVPVIIFNPHAHNVKIPIKITLSHDNLYTDANIIHAPSIDFKKAINHSLQLKNYNNQILDYDAYIFRYKDCQEMVELTFFDNFPSMGYYIYYIYEDNKEIIDDKAETTQEMFHYENNWCIIDVNKNGTFDLKLKSSGLVFKNLHYIEDQADAGDGYDFYELPNDIPLNNLELGANILCRKTKFGIEYSIKCSIFLPEALNYERTARLNNKTTQNITTKVIIYDQMPRIDFETALTNKIKDHRMRVVFPTPIHTDSVHASSIFDVVERGIGNERFAKTMHKWKQKGVPTSFMSEFVDIHENGKGSVALFNKGMPEYEARRTVDGIELIQTLFRSVRYMGGQMPGRGQAGSPYPTPDGQLMRPLKFEYALYFHENDWVQDNIFSRANEYILPIAIGGGKIIIPGRRPEQTDVSDSLPKDLDSSLRLVNIENPNIILTSFYLANEKEIIMRLFNPTQNLLKTQIQLGVPVNSLNVCNILEEPTTLEMGQVSLIADKVISLEIMPKKIITIKLKQCV